MSKKIEKYVIIENPEIGQCYECSQGDVWCEAPYCKAFGIYPFSEYKAFLDKVDSFLNSENKQNIELGKQIIEGQGLRYGISLIPFEPKRLSEKKVKTVGMHDVVKHYHLGGDDYGNGKVIVELHYSTSMTAKVSYIYRDTKNPFRYHTRHYPLQVQYLFKDLKPWYYEIPIEVHLEFKKGKIYRESAKIEKW